MIKSLLPNCRFLSLTSEVQGRDWYERSVEIDGYLDGLGMDLAEESVFLLFDSAPGRILHGEGSCQVARSVIGPKKEVQGPLLLSDWIQAPVYRKTLIASNWEGILDECYSQWENLQRQAIKVSASFMIVAKRRLEPELELSLEVLFSV